MLSIRIKYKLKTPRKRPARVRNHAFCQSQNSPLRLEVGTLPNLVFSSDKKKFDVHHVNPQNDRVWPRDGEVGL